MEQGHQGVGLNIHTQIHWTDHLAPICVAMGIPLLLTNEQHAQEAQALYPELQILLVDLQEITLQYLVENFDVFFQSQFWPRDDFYRQCQPWEQLYQKSVRNVHCPHGFSDKVFWHQKSAWEDILLVYGDNMFDLLKAAGTYEHLNATVRTGNYRYLYYRQHQAFFDQVVEERIWTQLDRSKPTILYAPTNNEVENLTSFFEAQQLLDQLPSDYNLVVKIHPHLEETNPAELYATMGKYEGRSNIVFIKDFPLVYPILARSNIYVGDVSSVGYDFLAFNRPMFFLNQPGLNASSDRNLFLYRCGFELKRKDYAKFYQLLESQLPFDRERYASIRQEVYRYTFGGEISFADLKEAIIQAYSSPKRFNSFSP
jgi:CDP-glycerol glycerophosphotransferase (TagB/SpsB family)